MTFSNLDLHSAASEAVRQSEGTLSTKENDDNPLTQKQILDQLLLSKLGEEDLGKNYLGSEKSHFSS